MWSARSSRQSRGEVGGTKLPARRTSGTLLRWLSEQVNRAAELACMAIVSVMVGVMAFGVASRFLFRAPVAWSDELSRYLFVWLSFLGASVALRRGMHMGMNFMVARLSPGTRRWLGWGKGALVAGFLATVGVTGFQLAGLVVGQRSPAMRIPMSWPYLAVPAGIGLMLLHVLADFWGDGGGRSETA